MQQQDWSSFVVIAILLAMFLAVGATALRKMRARRREQYAEPERTFIPEPSPVAEPTPHVEPAAPAPDTTPLARAAAPIAHELPAPVPEAVPQVVPKLVPPSDEAVVVAPAAPQVVPVPEGAPPAPAAVAVSVVDPALKAGLAKTQASFLGRINKIFSRKPGVDLAVLDELEEVLLTADVGVQLAMALMDDLRAKLKARELTDVQSVHAALRARLTAALQVPASPSTSTSSDTAKPHVILFVGVNGVGKTTTIGKLAAKFAHEKRQVLLVAGDTFRAAAAEQLSIWAERTGASIHRGAEGADPASVVFNGIDEAVKKNVDVVLADTAGRLHTKTELMDEIKKVKKAASKARAGAPDETWLVVDGTTGQNALQQAREFHQALGLTGVILTKLDGTAKGGVVVAIVDSLHIPVRFVGVGEKADDLRPFVADSFVAALFDEG